MTAPDRFSTLSNPNSEYHFQDSNLDFSKRMFLILFYVCTDKSYVVTYLHYVSSYRSKRIFAHKVE